MGFHVSAIFLALFVAVVSAQYPSELEATGFVQRQKLTDQVPASATVAYRARPAYSFNSQEEDEEEGPAPSYQTRRPQQIQQPQQQHQQQHQFRKPQETKFRPESEEELEEEEPDRLSLLLEKSNFNCGTRTTGYYADEGVGCEVFHYCQENQKHSWVCPEGFMFHQVHLICMPPSADNNCEQSSKYHFVNEYLYKPINMEEHQSRPNVTLRYSERYYPESFYLDERHEEAQQHQPQQQHQRQPIQVGLNIRKNPSTPQPYRQSSPQVPQNVYRSPEEINISLQQRRPVLFSTPTTPRTVYEEDEYNYEK